MGRFIDACRDETLIGLSPALAETLAEAAAGTGEPQFCLRRQRSYVLLGPQDMRLPDLSGGIRFIDERGIPVYRRVGGGAAVLLDEDCLSFAAAIPCRDIGRLDANFAELTAPVRRALSAMGIPARFGRAEGSYCEGPQDLVSADGRKIAGVSQALRQGYALVSGMLLVRQDPLSTTALLQGFYEAAGSTRRLRWDAVTSLSRRLGREVTIDEVAAVVREALAMEGAWHDGRLSEREQERARTLLRERRMRPPGSFAEDLARPGRMA